MIYLKFEVCSDTKSLFLYHGYVPFQPKKDTRLIVLNVPQKEIPGSPITKESVEMKLDALERKPFLLN